MRHPHKSAKPSTCRSQAPGCDRLNLCQKAKRSSKPMILRSSWASRLQQRRNSKMSSALSTTSSRRSPRSPWTAPGCETGRQEHAALSSAATQREPRARQGEERVQEDGDKRRRRPRSPPLRRRPQLQSPAALANFARPHGRPRVDRARALRDVRPSTRRHPLRARAPPDIARARREAAKPEPATRGLGGLRGRRQMALPSNRGGRRVCRGGSEARGAERSCQNPVRNRRLGGKRSRPPLRRYVGPQNANGRPDQSAAPSAHAAAEPESPTRQHMPQAIPKLA
jgi:hypothetical protein